MTAAASAKPAPTTMVRTPTTTVATNGQQIFLQVASFSNHQRAEEVARSLQGLPNKPAVHVKSINTSSIPVHRVQLGPFADPNQALQYAPHIIQLYPDTTPIVVTY